MSQTIVPPAPRGMPSRPAVSTGSSGSGATRPGPPSSRRASASATVRHYLDGSPGRLRMISAMAVIATVLAAVLGGAALRERSAALAEGAATAEHLLLVQDIQTNVTEADAVASNSFLRAGLELPAQRARYSAAIATATRELAIAARASSEDAQALGAVNAALATYLGRVESARANNRQGLPVGASYLATASALLTSEVVPPLEARAAADAATMDAAYARAGNARWWLALAALVGLGGLVWAQLYLVQHSRRIVNVPLAASTVGLLVALVLASAAMALAQSKADGVRHGALWEATDLSRSRVAAFGAKSVESLALIKRGSGAELDPA